MEYLIEITRVHSRNPETNWFHGLCRAVADPENDRPFDFGGEMPIAGVFPCINEGVPYRLAADIEEYRGAPQIKISKGCVPERVDRLISLEGIKRYLDWVKKQINAECQREQRPTPKIGAGRLSALLRSFGIETIEVARTDPERVAREVKGWNLERAEIFAAALDQRQADEAIMIELNTLGANGALSPAMQEQLFLDHGRGAPSVLRHDPYALIGKLKGFGWKRADTLAVQNLGMALSLPARIDAGLHETLRQNARDGHTWLPHRCPGDNHSGRAERPCCAIFGAWSLTDQYPGFHEALIVIDSRVELVAGRVYPKYLRDAEEAVADLVLDSKASGIRAASFPDLTEGLNELQMRAFEMALSGGLSILTGGPGRGKTHTLRAVLEAMRREGLRFALLAPTGRAAARAAEVTGCHAETIHRYLMKTQDQGDPQINHFVLDESSMIDISLMADFIRSVRRGQNLLLVGDCDQLPPVGPGRPFVDLIESGVVRSVQLEKVMRTDRQGIIRAAQIVNEGGNGRGPLNQLISIQDESFEWLTASGQEAQEAVVQSVQELVERGIDRDDIQVIVANNGYKNANCSKPLSNRALNQRLAMIFNPTGEPTGAQLLGDDLRIGDRVMNLDNQVDIEIFSFDGFLHKPRHGSVMNGEIGKVIDVAQFKGRESIVCEFDAEDSGAPRLFAWPLKKHNLAPCYAATCHKFQGSESKHVILAFDQSAGGLIDKSWLYTGITRASHSCLLIAPPEVVERAIRRPRKVSCRRSGLLELLNPDVPPF